MGDEEKSSADVVRLPIRRTLEPAKPSERSKVGHFSVCQHRRVEVQGRGKRERFVECATCGERLDPIAVLYDFARNERSFVSGSEAFRAERDRLEAEVEGLKKAQKRAKGKLRRLEEKHRVFALLKKLRAAARDIPKKANRWPIESIEREIGRLLRGELEAPEQAEINRRSDHG